MNFDGNKVFIYFFRMREHEITDIILLGVQTHFIRAQWVYTYNIREARRVEATRLIKKRIYAERTIRFSIFFFYY